MVKMDAVCGNTLLDVINDFEGFIDKLGMRTDELKELKSDALCFHAEISQLYAMC